MTRRPPPLAERLLIWSLAAADRDAVLGDLQEEFAALAAGTGAGAARRWYWTQTLTSVGPNLVRRIQGERQQRRMNESDSDRMMRKSVRTFSLWLIGVPVALGVLVWSQAQDLSFVIGFGGPMAFIGLLLLTANLFPHRTTDAQTMSRQLRRSRFFWTLVFVGSVPRLIVHPEHRQLLRDLNRAELALGIAILLWPKRYWPISPLNVPPECARVRTPFLSGFGNDGPMFLAADMPQKAAGLGDLIIARAKDARIGIDRVFRKSDGLRVYAPVSEGATPVSATIDLLDQWFHVIDTMPAPVEPASLVDDAADRNGPRSEAKQLDVTIPLEELTPGFYRLRVTATDGPNTSEREAAFRVTA